MADQGGSGGAEAASVVVPTAGKPMELRRLLILAAGTTAVVGLVFIGGMWLWREANKKRGKKPTKNSRKKPSEQAGKSRHATDYDKDNQPEDQAALPQLLAIAKKEAVGRAEIIQYFVSTSAAAIPETNDVLRATEAMMVAPLTPLIRELLDIHPADLGTLLDFMLSDKVKYANVQSELGVLIKTMERQHANIFATKLLPSEPVDPDVLKIRNQHLIAVSIVDPESGMQPMWDAWSTHPLFHKVPKLTPFIGRLYMEYHIFGFKSEDVHVPEMPGTLQQCLTVCSAALRAAIDLFGEDSTQAYGLQLYQKRIELKYGSPIGISPGDMAYYFVKDVSSLVVTYANAAYRDGIATLTPGSKITKDRVMQDAAANIFKLIAFTGSDLRQAQQLAASLVVEFYDSKMDPDSAMAAMLHLTQRFYSLELTYVLLPQLIEYAKKKSIYHSERLEVRILTHNAMLGFVFKDFEMVTLNYAVLNDENVRSPTPMDLTLFQSLWIASQACSAGDTLTQADATVIEKQLTAAQRRDVSVYYLLIYEAIRSKRSDLSLRPLTANEASNFGALRSNFQSLRDSSFHHMLATVIIETIIPALLNQFVRLEMAENQAHRILQDKYKGFTNM